MHLPENDEEFTITSQMQNRDSWVNHPVDQTLRTAPGAKLRSIPVRLIFDDPELNLRANCTMFDRKTGRPLCVGNGISAGAPRQQVSQTLPCPLPGG